MASPPLLLPPPETSPPPSSNPSPQKKIQPIPWTHQETFNLIQAYQEKWYSLKKGQLKASQWEEVSITVAARCGFDEPSKSSTQCRHKIEKLRKRYRAERLKPGPNSWQYFDLMDRMERGPGLLPIAAHPVAMVKCQNPNSNLNPPDHHHQRYYYDINNTDFDEVDVSLLRNKSKSINHMSRMAKDGNFISEKRKGYFENLDVDDDYDDDDDDFVDRNLNRMGKDRNFGVRMAKNQNFGVRMAKDRNFVTNIESMGFNDCVGVEEEDENEDDEEESVGGIELAAEIRGFTERFMRMESKKMEMMKETERYRMEMEKRRMEMILETQGNLIDTITGVLGSNKKVKMAQDF